MNHVFVVVVVVLFFAWKKK